MSIKYDDEWLENGWRFANTLYQQLIDEDANVDDDSLFIKDIPDPERFFNEADVWVIWWETFRQESFDKFVAKWGDQRQLDLEYNKQLREYEHFVDKNDEDVEPEPVKPEFDQRYLDDKYQYQVFFDTTLSMYFKQLTRFIRDIQKYRPDDAPNNLPLPVKPVETESDVKNI